MAISYLTHEYAFVAWQTIESNSAILGDNKQVCVSISELEEFDSGINLDLVLDQEWFSVIRNDVVTILTHDSESLIAWRILFIS